MGDVIRSSVTANTGLLVWTTTKRALKFDIEELHRRRKVLVSVLSIFQAKQIPV